MKEHHYLLALMPMYSHVVRLVYKALLCVPQA